MIKCVGGPLHGAPFDCTTRFLECQTFFMGRMYLCAYERKRKYWNGRVIEYFGFRVPSYWPFAGYNEFAKYNENRPANK